MHRNLKTTCLGKSFLTCAGDLFDFATVHSEIGSMNSLALHWIRMHVNANSVVKFSRIGPSVLDLRSVAVRVKRVHQHPVPILGMNQNHDSVQNLVKSLLAFLLKEEKKLIFDFPNSFVLLLKDFVTLLHLFRGIPVLVHCLKRLALSLSLALKAKIIATEQIA